MIGRLFDASLGNSREVIMIDEISVNREYLEGKKKKLKKISAVNVSIQTAFASDDFNATCTNNESTSSDEKIEFEFSDEQRETKAFDDASVDTESGATNEDFDIIEDVLVKPIREAISFAGEVERKVKTNIDANQKLVFKALENLQNNEKFSDNSDEAYLDYSDLNDERSSSKVDLNLMKPQAFDDKIVARNPNAPYPYNNDGSSNKVEDLAWKI